MQTEMAKTQKRDLKIHSRKTRVTKNKKYIFLNIWNTNEDKIGKTQH